MHGFMVHHSPSAWTQTCLASPVCEGASPSPNPSSDFLPQSFQQLHSQHGRRLPCSALPHALCHSSCSLVSGCLVIISIVQRKGSRAVAHGSLLWHGPPRPSRGSFSVAGAAARALRPALEPSRNEAGPALRGGDCPPQGTARSRQPASSFAPAAYWAGMPPALQDLLASRERGLCGREVRSLAASATAPRACPCATSLAAPPPRPPGSNAPARTPPPPPGVPAGDPLPSAVRCAAGPELRADRPWGLRQPPRLERRRLPAAVGLRRSDGKSRAGGSRQGGGRLRKGHRHGWLLP